MDLRTASAVAHAMADIMALVPAEAVCETTQGVIVALVNAASAVLAAEEDRLRKEEAWRLEVMFAGTADEDEAYETAAARAYADSLD